MKLTIFTDKFKLKLTIFYKQILFIFFSKWNINNKLCDQDDNAGMHQQLFITYNSYNDKGYYCN